MNQFHTPSFGDEVFEIHDGPEPNSKRIRSLEHTAATMVDDYQNLNEIDVNNSYVMHAPATANVIAPTHQNNMIATPATILPGTLTARKPVNMATEQNITSPNKTIPTEPKKPLSAYALFFRDTVNAIKQQKPTSTFGEISTIVVSMWESLDEATKNQYNKKHELAKQEFVIAMRNHMLWKEQQQQQQQETTSQLATSDQQAQLQTFDYNATSLLSNQQQQQQQTNLTQLSSHPDQQQQQSNAAITTSVGDTQNSTGTTTLIDTTIGASAASMKTPASNTTPPQQIQLLTEAAGTQKCTRENCNKPAIINPDWEDEYCSNECVVIHCRNVFNDWVKGKKDSPATSTSN